MQHTVLDRFLSALSTKRTKFSIKYTGCPKKSENLIFCDFLKCISGDIIPCYYFTLKSTF